MVTDNVPPTTISTDFGSIIDVTFFNAKTTELPKTRSASEKPITADFDMGSLTWNVDQIKELPYPYYTVGKLM